MKLFPWIENKIPKKLLTNCEIAFDKIIYKFAIEKRMSQLVNCHYVSLYRPQNYRNKNSFSQYNAVPML